MVKATGALVPLAVLGLLAACAETPKPVEVTAPSAPSVTMRSGAGYKVGKAYQVNGIWYYPRIDYDYSEVGVASWYGPGFHGQPTANGEIYDMNDLTAAHKTLPLPSIVRVTNLDNGRSIKLRVNDRGPFVNGRIIDVSRRAAQMLGFYGSGTTRVQVDIEGEESRILAERLTGQSLPALARKAPAAPVVVASASPLASPDPSELATSTAGPVIGDVPPTAPTNFNGPVVSTDSVEQSIPAYTPAAEAIVVPEPIFPPTVEEISMPPPTYAPAVEVAAIPPPAPRATPVAAPPPPPAVAAVTPSLSVSPTPSVRPAPRGVATGTFVQAGAYADPQNANRARERLSGLGPIAVMPLTVAGRPLYRVRLGPLASNDEIERVHTAAVRAGFLESRVVAE